MKLLLPTHTIKPPLPVLKQPEVDRHNSNKNTAASGIAVSTTRVAYGQWQSTVLSVQFLSNGSDNEHRGLTVLKTDTSSCSLFAGLSSIPLNGSGSNISASWLTRSSWELAGLVRHLCACHPHRCLWSWQRLSNVILMVC